MKPREDLFQLIRSLTPNEKSAFTKASVADGKKVHQYVLLYQALDSLPGSVYDENVFLASKIGEPFRKHHSVKKAQLYDNILSVLRSRKQFGGTEKPLEFQIRGLLEDAWLLKEKKLFEQSKRRLSKARTEAEKYHFHEVLLEILKLDRTLLLESSPKGVRGKVADLHKEISVVTEAIDNKFKMLALKDEIFIFVRQHAELHGAFDREAITDLMKEPVLQNVALCKSFEAESNYHFCHAMYQYLIEDLTEAWIHARSQYLMWQEHKGVQKVKAIDYRNVLHNYLSFCNEALRYEDFDNAIGQLEKGPFHSDEEKASALHNLLNVRLQKALNLCDWTQVETIFKVYKKQRAEFGERLPKSRSMTFYLSFSRLFMVKEDWKNSIRWAKMVLDEGGKDSPGGLVFEAHLQETISLFSLRKHEDVIKKCRYILDTYRRAGRPNEFEKRILTILKRCSESGNISELPSKFQTVLKEMADQLKNRRMKDSVTRAWVVSIANKCSLREVLESDFKAIGQMLQN
jgi:hypothetical protein